MAMLCFLFRLCNKDKKKDQSEKGMSNESMSSDPMSSDPMNSDPMSSNPGMSSNAMSSPHATATINGKVVADASNWEVVEGNIYFPPESLDRSVFTSSSTSTTCPWKGQASYYNIVIDGKEVKDVAWYYPTPGDRAQNIKGYVAFYGNKVQVKSS